MFCPSCGNSVPAGARYCIGCGSRINAHSLPDAPPKLTERKFVTVVFIDMVGSLSAIQDKDPEDAHEVLTEAMNIMALSVHAFGGVVAETAGDGIMAIFGAPAAQEDHAERACYAALRLHATVAQSVGSQIAIRVGINSGEVAVGITPNDFSSDYTATGAVVHIAARLQSVARPNETVMTASTLSLVSGSMLTEAIGPSMLKGLPGTIEIHRLIGARPAAEPLSVVEHAFVGRAHELEALHGSLAAANSGHGCVVAVSGEAGIGKSALISRFTAGLNDCEVIRCNAEYHASFAPLRLFADVVTRLCPSLALQGPRGRESLAHWLANLGLARESYEQPLVDLMGIDTPLASWSERPPLVRSDLISATVVQVLFAASKQRRLVVVIEDLHRADSSTLDLIDHLIKAIDDGRLMMIIAFRPELSRRWAGSSGYRELRLERLGDIETRTLLADFLGEKASARIEGQLIGWSKGNPLFLRESVRALAEAGAIDDADAAATVRVPSSINDAIAARIDRLEPSAKRVLLAASVLGPTFALELLARVSGASGTSLERHLSTLVREEFIRPMQAADHSYCFEHELFREVGYATLLRSQRREFHREAFVALGQLHDGESTAPRLDLAHHAYGGELWAEAVSVCSDAGRRSAARYANREAALHFENAIAALERSDTAGRRLQEAIELRLELRSVCIPLLRLNRINTLLVEANRLAQQLGDVSYRARVVAFRAGHAYLTESVSVCAELCREALGLARQSPDETLQLAPILYLAQADYGSGKYRLVVGSLDAGYPRLSSELSGSATGLPVRPTFMRSYWLAISRAELGQFDRALQLVADMESSANDQQPFESLYALTAHGFVLMLRGEFASALEFSERALEVAEHYEVAFIIPVLASQGGFLLAMQGRVAQGLAAARRSMRKATEIGITAGKSRWCARAAETCLIAGEIDEAWRYCVAAVDSAEGGGELGYLCSALRLRAKLHAMNGEFDKTAADLARATSLAFGLRSGPAIAKCLVDAGVVGLRLGQTDQAYRAIAIAVRMFARYRAPAFAERASQALRAASADGNAMSCERLFGSCE